MPPLPSSTLALKFCHSFNNFLEFQTLVELLEPCHVGLNHAVHQESFISQKLTSFFIPVKMGSSFTSLSPDIELLLSPTRYKYYKYTQILSHISHCGWGSLHKQQIKKALPYRKSIGHSLSWIYLPQWAPCMLSQHTLSELHSSGHVLTDRWLIKTRNSFIIWRLICGSPLLSEQFHILCIVALQGHLFERYQLPFYLYFWLQNAFA